ncbi:histone acetyltransferase p300 [Folsomia candida]|uniref:histone acetyltransferase n=1 Tax=Folsomia candida TaxID=158441 RepID=A0A226EZP2_FOLCA|nr:histone acetyltransferase p300 [Folsomia candida]XP_035714808.1 histone acetyltransferase p300 [Folsomia candida]XP_035714812.1 histone acetyltransferase p300 [Folsomia candida]OXA62614.1 CREB-binding protein [Folsomia candida]
MKLPPPSPGKNMLKTLIKTPVTRGLQPPSGHAVPEIVTPTPSIAPSIPSSAQSIEQKRILIRKQLVILLHAIVCRRREHRNRMRDPTFSSPPCNVPFCGLMKTTQIHLNACKEGEACRFNHCASSRQILIHWKYCVKAECPVCVSLRRVVPTSLLQIFPNPLCRAEIMQRVARQQQGTNHGEDQAVPELMESEE